MKLNLIQGIALVIGAAYLGIFLCLVIGETVTKIKTYFNTPKNGEVTMRKNERLHRAMGKVNEKVSNGKNLTKEVLKRAKSGAEAILQKLGLVKKKLSNVEYKKE